MGCQTCVSNVTRRGMETKSVVVLLRERLGNTVPKYKNQKSNQKSKLGKEPKPPKTKYKF
jgi:hypothetical protein